MKVVIIEDERPAWQRLCRLLNEIDPNIEIITILESVEAAVNWLYSNSHAELIFMDIQLEDGICFEIFDNCNINTPIIFTTAYDKYTLKAFKVNSIDYLLKPIALDELKNSIEKFKSIHSQKNELLDINMLLDQFQTKTKERFLVKIGSHLKSIPTSQINCFFIKERCNFIVVESGKTFAIDYSLDKIEKLVDDKSFFRVNRNIIINISAITDILTYSSSRLKIVLSNWSGNEIIVSRERVTDFKKWIDR